MHNGKKCCFVITPIGEDGTDVRRKADLVLHHVIDPAAKSRGYHEVVRADGISKPGVITTQIIEHIIEAPLVVADLSGHNPNVMYELALRHAIRKPVVQLIAKGEKIPFDVSGNRTIPYELDLDGAEKARVSIGEQIDAVETDPLAVDSPISTAVQVNALRSGSNTEQNIAKVLESIQAMRAEFSESNIAAVSILKEVELARTRTSIEMEEAVYLRHSMMRIYDHMQGVLRTMRATDTVDTRTMDALMSLNEDMERCMGRTHRPRAKIHLHREDRIVGTTGPTSTILSANEKT